MPAFGGFGSTPTQTNSFGSATQPSQPAFGSSIFGSSTPFGASSQPTFGSTGAPSFGATSTPAFGAPSAFAADPQEAEAMRLFEFMTKLKDAGLSNIFSESDCKIVVHGMSCTSPSNEFGLLLTRCQHLYTLPNVGVGVSDPQEAEAMYLLDLEVIKWLKDGGLSNTFSESDTGFMEELRGQPFNYSVVSCPVFAEEDGGTSGQTAKLESISAMPAYKYKRFESCFAIAGADYCVIAADYTHYHHTKISQVTEKCVMATSGLQAHVNALQEALSNLIDKHQHNKPMSCPKIDRLLSNVLFFSKYHHPYTVLAGFDSEGKGRVFTRTDGVAMYERAGYISQEEIIPPILEYELPAEDVLTRLSETEAVNLAKTIFASTTCTGDKLEIVVLNASGLRREYMDLRKKD